MCLFQSSGDSQPLVGAGYFLKDNFFLYIVAQQILFGKLHTYLSILYVIAISLLKSYIG